MARVLNKLGKSLGVGLMKWAKHLERGKGFRWNNPFRHMTLQNWIYHLLGPGAAISYRNWRGLKSEDIE